MPVENKAVCLGCAAGYFSNVTGAVLCHACQPGYYSSGNGVTVCLMCEVGHYADLPEQVVCEVNLFIYLFRAISLSVIAFSLSADWFVQPCPAGRYSNSAASSSCQYCAPGSYQGLPAQSQCVTCGDGQFSATHGSLYCPG